MLVSLALRIVPIYVFNMTLATIYILFFAIGFFTSAQVITYPVIAESNVKENIGAGLSMGSTLIMSGGAILVPIFGLLLNFHWQGAMLHGTPWHSVSEYQSALWLLPITTVIGSIAVLLGKETYCKPIATQKKRDKMRA